MNNDVCDVYERFRDFPPLYTEQINDVALSKQLEIWEIVIRSSLEKEGLFFLNVDDSGIAPFHNAKIQRVLKREFMTLLAQHMVERGYGYYHHIITSFCKSNKCSVWGALFINRKTRASQLRILHCQEYTRISSYVKDNHTSIGVLKAKRDALFNDPLVVGLFVKRIDETVDDVLRHLKAQLTSIQVETPYYLFYSERESTKPFRTWPEEHIAMIISILATQERIVITSNETVALSTLNSKQLGVQLS